MHDARHREARLVAQHVRIDRHITPRSDLQAVMMQCGFGATRAADDVMRIEEEHAYG